MLTYPNAKINIGLNVVERRPDKYHNIETVFYPISLHDRLNVNRKDKLKDWRLSLQGIDIEGRTDDNLVIKTYQVFRDKFNIGGVDISLRKQIPMGSGLGGGSSDAAYMAQTLNRIFKLQLSDEQLMDLLTQIGSDCPFFVLNRPVFAEGVGNCFTPINLNLQGWFLIIVIPPIHISTAKAYANIVPQKSVYNITDIINSVPVEEWHHYIKNDFESYAFAQHPLFQDIRQMLYDMGAAYVSLSGSGAAMYGLFRFAPAHKKQFKGCYTFFQTL